MDHIDSECEPTQGKFSLSVSVKWGVFWIDNMTNGSESNNGSKKDKPDKPVGMQLSASRKRGLDAKAHQDESKEDSSDE